MHFCVKVRIVHENVTEGEGIVTAIVTVIVIEGTGAVETEIVTAIVIVTAAVRAGEAVVAEDDRDALRVQKCCLVCKHV